MTLFVPVFLLAFLLTIILVVRCAYQLAVRRGIDARNTALTLAAFLAVYAAALIGTSLASQKETLAMGAVKCFDDWCVSVDGAKRSGDQLSVHLATINHGRRPQVPDSPHAFVVIDGRQIPVSVPHLTDKIEGGSTRPIDININLPAGARIVEFLITEGGGPSNLIINDENSPLHAHSTWAVRK